MAADYTPTLGNYKTLQPFRYWCQKVLPLVYDDSLSYYELLNKVVDYLNKTMEDVETLNGDVEALHAAYVLLQNYVNDYFDNLDVQEEINNRLDEMAENGTLSALILPLLQHIMTPIFVNNTSEMTNTDRIYVLLPSGNMYYYDGNAWVNSGFVYGVTSESFRFRDEVTDNLSNHTDSGFYRIHKSDSMTDLPSGYAGSWGALIVYDLVPTSGYCFQMLKSAGYELYFRLVNRSTHVGETWNRVVRANEATRFYYRGAINDLLASHTDPGFYTISKTDSMTDLPSGYAGSVGSLIIYNPGPTNDYTLQLLKSGGNEMYFRIVNKSTQTGTWSRIVRSEELNNFIKKEPTAISSGHLTDYTDTGIYKGNKSNVDDVPEVAEGNYYTMFVLPEPYDGYCKQIYVDSNGSVFHRYVNKSTHTVYWTNWVIDSFRRAEYRSVLTGKRWIACGDSFTRGDYTGISPVPAIGEGFFSTSVPIYPLYIGNRTGVRPNTDFAVNGATLAPRTDGSSGYSLIDHYTEIPENADIITLYYGINDSARCTLGTIDDTTPTTFYGSLYTIIHWLQTNRPNARLGLIATNSGNISFVNATKQMALKMGVPCLDMNSPDHMLVISSHNPDASAEAKALANQKYRVSTTNNHPNALCHKLESYFIENWLMSL